MQRIVDATLDAAVVAIVAAILFAFGIVAAVLKVWRTLKTDSNAIVGRSHAPAFGVCVLTLARVEPTVCAQQDGLQRPRQRTGFPQGGQVLQ